jgi:hypothetical protein
VVEPFAGSAGYATFHGCREVLLIDADPVIVALWQYLIAATPAQILELPEVSEVGDSVDNYRLPQEAKWLIGFWLNRGSAQPKKTRTAYSARTDRAQLNWGPRAKARIAAQLPALAGWRALHGTYESAPDVRATWFIDPPYRVKGHYYRTAFSDYVALAPWCKARQGRVIVCEGQDATWLPFEPLGSFKSSRGRALEMVWGNG